MLPWMVKSFVESEHPRDEEGKFSLHEQIAAHFAGHKGTLASIGPEELKSEMKSAEEILSQVNKLSNKEVKVLAKKIGIEGIGAADSKMKIVQRIKNRLTILNRMSDRIEGSRMAIEERKGLSWMVIKMSRFDEAKHKRGDSKNAGHFAAGSGGGGGAKPKPRTSGKVSGPSRGISQPGKGKPPATPYGVRPNLPANMPALPNKKTPPPLPGDTYQVSQPHLQTQQSAIQAGNAALQEAASGNVNGPAKQAFAKALHAHYAAGVMALQKMANEKYGPGPKADAARKQAEQVFVGKIRAAWAKVNTPQGGAQPAAAAPAQPKQTRIREFTRDQPPPVPGNPAKLASEAIARRQTTIGPSRNDANMSAQDKSDAEVRSNLEKLILGHPQSQKAGLTPEKLAGLKGSQIADIAYKMGIRNSGGATSSRLDPKDTEGGNNTYYFLHPVVETEAEKKRTTADSGAMERTRASNAAFHKRTAARNAAAKKKKSISDALITKSFDTFSDMDLSVELPDDPLPAWMVSRKKK